MLSSAPVMLLLGIVLGFLSGLGVGGGSLLMLLLTFGLHLDYPVARIVNLLFFIPGAIIASAFRCRQVQLPLNKLTGAMVAGCISALLLSAVSKQLDIYWIQKCFGIILLITGVRELLYRERKAR